MGGRASVRRSPTLSTSRNAARILPPLVVVAVLGAVAWAVATRRDREPREEAIRARWDAAGESAELARETEAYLQEFGDDPEARWFAAEAFVRARRLWQAFDAVFRGEPGAAPASDRRRFGRLLIDRLGHLPGSIQSPLYPRTLLARIEAGDPGADAELRRAVAEMPVDAMVLWYVPAHRTHTVATTALGRALVALSDPMAKIAGTSLITAPGSGVSVDPLVEVLPTAFRVERTPTWYQVCRGLGVSGDAKAVEALKRERERLGDRAYDDSAMIDEHRFGLDVGLALAGDEAARRTVETRAGDPALQRPLLAYAVGLQGRLAAGDAEAAARLVALHDAAPPGQVRMQVFFGLALSDVMPHPDVPMDRMAADLAAGGTSFQLALARIWALRRGLPQGPAWTERSMRDALEQPEANDAAADGEGEGSATAYEVARAWLRWSR